MRTSKKYTTLSAALLSVLLVGGGLAVPAAAAAEEGCTEIRSTVPKPVLHQPKVLDDGRVKVSWTPTGHCVDGFELYLKLESIDNNRKGATRISVDSEAATSYIISASRLRKLQAPIGSGRHFNIRMRAVTSKASSALTPRVITMAGQPKAAPPAKAATVHVASYNMAIVPELSNAQVAQRRGKLAKQVVASGAAVVAVQESVKLTGRDNTQLKPMLSAIKKAQKKTKKAASWKWVRDTMYARPGTTSGGDGTRILYDAKQVRLLSTCKNTTGKLKYSSSCAIKLPRKGGGVFQRWAAVVQFQDKATKKKFWVVSAHLEPRKGSTFDKNRAKQLNTIVKAVNKKNKKGEPVILAGDLNLGQTRAADLKTLNAQLVGKGYVNAMTAAKAKNLKYRTFNNWKKTPVEKSGYGVRIDHIYARGGVYFANYETKPGRASDHNLIRATLKF